jgi:hypothetical protein
MQYILTEQELQALKREKQGRTDSQNAELLKLCKLAAEHIPVPRPWTPEKPPAPWGCILTEDRMKNPRYCDCCPARHVCPHEGKEFSK